MTVVLSLLALGIVKGMLAMLTGIGDSSLLHSPGIPVDYMHRSPTLYGSRTSTRPGPAPARMDAGGS